VHTEDGMHSRDRRPLPSPPVRALALLADPVRQAIVWELAHQPRTVTELARRIQCSQPTVSKHLRHLRQAGLVEAQPHESDGRARLYDIRREPLIELHAWIRDLQQAWWQRTRHIPIDPDYYKRDRLDPNTTTRGTDRIRTPRQLKDPWDR
jgi:DNA-binding transcriptional ArsR family regulator